MRHSNADLPELISLGLRDAWPFRDGFREGALLEGASLEQISETLALTLRVDSQFQLLNERRGIHRV